MRKDETTLALCFDPLARLEGVCDVWEGGRGSRRVCTHGRVLFVDDVENWMNGGEEEGDGEEEASLFHRFNSRADSTRQSSSRD